MDALPEGWQAVASASREGEVSYVNIYTGERIAWPPVAPAHREPGRIEPPADGGFADADIDGRISWRHCPRAGWRRRSTCRRG